MPEPGATLLARLTRAVGAAHVVTAPSAMAPFLTDWRGRYRGSAVAVALPQSTAEVSEVVRACAEADVGIVPQGGNTGLCGGSVPAATGAAVVVCLTRMNRVRDVDPDNMTITAEAGVPLAGVQAAAAAAGLLFPLSLASEGSCTLGGNVSTNAGGTAVLRYGNTRDLTLGLEAVLADGSVFPALRGLRKDNTGYDLKQLFIGAEGTLGIVTAAVMKLFPAPRTQVTALVAVPSAAAAIALLGRLQAALGDRLVGFELMGALALDLSRRYHPGAPPPPAAAPWYVLVQADDATADAPLPALVEAALGGAIGAGDALDATVAQSLGQARELWALRENISEAQRRAGPNVKNDISLPVSRMTHFLAACEAALIAALPGARLVVFGHLGDGNLHYNISGPEDVPAERFMAQAPVAMRIVNDLVAAHGGSFSAEHGIGQLKRDELVRYKSEVEIALMRAVKRTLDPHHRMNPGKVL
ncbi:MAG: FAD-binding oxidoreductase [Burkholderiales bacterium]|nr:FAD-binding oxidoreductase [Burkholderiales bacterium]